MDRNGVPEGGGGVTGRAVLNLVCPVCEQGIELPAAGVAVLNPRGPVAQLIHMGCFERTGGKLTWCAPFTLRDLPLVYYN